jgi:Transposase DDE domain
VSTPARKPRVRYGPLPELPAEVAFPYANTRADALTPAQTVRAMLDSDAWQRVVKPELDAREAERRDRKKVAPDYSCEELESVLLYQAVAGLDTLKRTREQLTSHAGAEARGLLGFDRPRPSDKQHRLHAVPSEPTLSRYTLSFAPKHAGALDAATAEAVARGQAPSQNDLKRAEVERQKAAYAVRAELYERLFAELVREYAKTREAAAAARILFLDGTALNTLFQCRITEGGVPVNDTPRPRERCVVKPVLDRPGREGGRLVWDGRLTTEQWEALKSQPREFRRYWSYSADGGFAAGDSPSRNGHGYGLINIVDSAGMPLAFTMTPIQTDERDGALMLLDRIGPRLADFGDDGIRVLVADAGFNGSRIAKKVRALGMLESIHSTSASARDRSQSNATQRRSKQMYIEYFDRQTGQPNRNWYTDGHRALFCDCGRGEVQKRFRHKQDGELVVGLEGQCATCGPISITSGQWRYAGKRWHKVVGSNPNDQPDYAMGNPLNFDSPIAKVYGKRRYAVQEGVHSVLTTRFGLIRGARRIKHIDEARLKTAMTFCVMHLLAAEQRKRAARDTKKLTMAA